jgi:hypothetical protein
MPANNKLPLKRFAKGSILLQSAHFSTLRPTASACQHVALASPGALSAFQLFVGVLRDQSFREGL